MAVSSWTSRSTRLNRLIRPPGFWMPWASNRPSLEGPATTLTWLSWQVRLRCAAPPPIFYAYDPLKACAQWSSPAPPRCARLRFYLALLCPPDGYQRRPGDRLGPYSPGAILG